MAVANSEVLPVREKEPVAESVADEAPEDDDDAPLDPTKYIEAHILARLDDDYVDYYLNEVVKKAPKTPVTIDDIRARPEDFRSAIAVDTGTGYFPRVETHALVSAEGDGGAFEARVYHPDPAEHGAGPYPVHINYHGGGFVLGDLQAEAQLCLAMREAGVVVVDVNYRHCPETTWGTFFDDGWSALLWTRAEAARLNINADSVSIGGISAGGHITLVVHQRARDAGIPLRLAMPTVTPATGCLFYEYYVDSPYKSFVELARTPGLPWGRVQFFGGVGLDSVRDEEAGVGAENDDGKTARQKRLAFLQARYPARWLDPLGPASGTDFRGLADVFVRTGELDMLRDEGEAYALAVAAAGGRATLKRYLGAVHIFPYLDFSAQKRVFDIDSVAALRQAHGLAALAADEVAARVDRVAAAVKAKQALEKGEREEKKKEEKKKEEEEKEYKKG